MQNQVTAMAPPTSRLNQNDGFVQMDRLAIKTNAIPWSQASLQNNWRFIVHPAVKQITFDTLACSLSALLSLHWTRSLQIVNPNLDFQIQLALGPDQPSQKESKKQSWTAPPNWQSRIRFHPADLDLWKAGDVQPCGPWALHLLHLVDRKLFVTFWKTFTIVQNWLWYCFQWKLINGCSWKEQIDFSKLNSQSLMVVKMILICVFKNILHTLIEKTLTY